MRLCAALVLLALVFAPLPNAAPSSRARTDGPAVDLTMEGENGAAIPVDGIACDNLRATPMGLRDRLDVRLPAGYSAQDVLVKVCSPDGSAVDADGRNNVGTAEAATIRPEQALQVLCPELSLTSTAPQLWARRSPCVGNLPPPRRKEPTHSPQSWFLQVLPPLWMLFRPAKS